MAYSLDQLYKFAETFLSEIYGLELKIPIEISSRMKSKLGVFIIRGVEAYKIKLSKDLLEYQDDQTVLDVLYHECVHYALFTLKFPYKDGNDYFEQELKRLGISSTYSYTHKGIVYLYKCPHCQILFHKRMKGFEKRYKCGRCNRKFKFLGEQILQ